MPPVAYQSVFQRQFQRHLGFLVEAAKLLDMQLVTTQQVFQYRGGQCQMNTLFHLVHGNVCA